MHIRLLTSGGYEYYGKYYPKYLVEYTMKLFHG